MGKSLFKSNNKVSIVLLKTKYLEKFPLENIVVKIVEKEREAVRCEKQTISNDVYKSILDVNIHLKNIQNECETVNKVANEKLGTIQKSQKSKIVLFFLISRRLIISIGGGSCRLKVSSRLHLLIRSKCSCFSFFK